MDNLLAARSQMALSLGFHIIFAAIGIAMPFLMATSHWFYLRRRDDDFLVLTKAWSKGVAIFFAVGAVSGTALSFELGLLWPRFMEHAGPIIGMPFSWEGTAFFLEAIALGIFLYGWGKIPRWSHWMSGVAVGISGVLSAFFVICANGWMNSPAGFDWNNGHPINIDPYRAMFNDAALLQGLHMTIGAFQAVGFAVAGFHAWLWIKTKYPIHLKALKIAFVFAAVSSLIQPFIGDLSAKSVAKRQPAKLAAMEALFVTQTRAPLLIGGWPNTETKKVEYGIEIPRLLSFLAFADFDAEVKGLDQVPREDWPPVPVAHFAFQIMVGLGTLLAFISALGLAALVKRPQVFLSALFQKVLVFCIPLGFIAIEAGWTVTEVGRQPWIIYKILRTRDALTPRPGVIYTFGLYGVIYSFLSVVVAILLLRQVSLLHKNLRNKRRTS